MGLKTKLANFYETINMAEDYLNNGYYSKRAKVMTVALKNRLLPNSLPDDFDGVATKEPPLSLRANSQIDLALSIDALSDLIINCQQCYLAKTRKNSITGYGIMTAELLIIGDALSTDDETLGKPFQGLTGQFLDKWLVSIGLNRDEHCYLTTVVKCRPPQSREPNKEEVELCLPYIKKLVSLLKPKAILCCGRTASQNITQSYLSLEELRNGTYYYEGIEVVTTYHPRHVLKNANLKRPVWEDLKRLKRALGH